ncbi:beta strand repeat-containing protein, partial [Flavobacterium chuncheonense]
MKKILLVFSLLFSVFVFSQSPDCATASAMCSGQGGPYLNTNTGTVGGNQTGYGNITGCGGSNSHGNNGSLGSTPRPAWFTLTIGQSGPIELNLQQFNNSGNGIDVDFALWGPFPNNNLSAICNSLSGFPGTTYTGPCNLVDASYSSTFNETIHIPNAQEGETYLLLVTNFSGQAGTFTINQTGVTPSSGQISCDVVCGVDLGPDRFFCGNVTNVDLVAEFNQAPTTAGTPTYTWYFNGGTTPFATTTTNTLNVTASGTYSVEVIRPGCSDVATDEIEVTFNGSVPFNSPGNVLYCGTTTNPFDLTQLEAGIVAPNDPNTFVFNYVDEIGNPITDPTNFVWSGNTMIGIEVLAGVCGNFDFISLTEDCPPLCELDLTSAVGTDNQIICLTDAIVDIVYTAGGEATGATVTGLPLGLTSVFNPTDFTLTISGTPTESGVFNYTVTTSGCTADVSQQGTIDVRALSNAGTIAGNQAICVAGTTTFVSDGDAGGTWSSSNTAIATVDTATGIVTGVSAGTATITYYLAAVGSCPADSSTIDVTVTTPPNAGMVSGIQAICIGGTTTFVSDGDAGGTWSSVDPSIATVDASTGVITGVSAGITAINYTVTGTGGCLDVVSTLDVTVTTPPNAGALTGNQAICVAGTTTFVSDGDTGGTFSSGDTTIATVDASGIITGVSAGTATITYTVLGTGGCADTFTTLDVTVTTPPNAGVLSGNQAICIAGTTTFVSDGDTGGSFTSADTSIATVDTTTGVITGVSAGTATITYTVLGTGGCADTFTTLDVTVTTPPNAGVLSGNQAICIAGTTTYTSNGNAGGTFSSGDATIATVDTTTGVITGVSAGTATITYTVLGTGGCADAFTTLDVTVTTPPNAGVLSGNQAICIAGTTTFMSDGDAGGTFSSNNTAVATVDTTTGVITGVSAGTATITYTVLGTGGCADTFTTLDVTVTTPPNAGVLSGNQAICIAGTTTFMSDGDAGGTFSSNNTAVATVDTTTGVITGVSAGTATITYTVLGTGGCADTFTTLDVTVTTPPNAGVLSGNQAICIAGTTTYTSNGDAGGTFSSGDATIATVDTTTGVITGVSAGTATITYTVLGTG